MGNFFFSVLIIAFAILFVVVALNTYSDWRERKRRAALPRPHDAGPGLFEPERFYIVTLKTGERVGPVRFEGYATLHDDGIPHAHLSFRKPDDKRLILVGLAIRLAEEVDAPGTPL